MKRELGSTIGRWPKMGEAAFQWVNECIATALSIRLFQVIFDLFSGRISHSYQRSSSRCISKTLQPVCHRIYGMIAYYNTALHLPTSRPWRKYLIGCLKVWPPNCKDRQAKHEGFHFILRDR
jgi:hypothetical protein